MIKFIKLTQVSQTSNQETEVYVNVGQIKYFKQKNAHTDIYIYDTPNIQLSVKQTPEEIYNKIKE